MMDPIQRTVAIPPRKIIMQRAARRKVFWNVAPLAPSAEDIHHAIHDRPHVRPPLAAAAFGGRDKRLDKCPFVIGQVARISQVIAVVLRPVLVRPHWRPPRIKNQEGVHRIQVIPRNQEVSGRTLTPFEISTEPSGIFSLRTFNKKKLDLRRVSPPCWST